MGIEQANSPIHLPTQEVLDVSGVERELTNLWTNIAGQDQDEDGGMIRARVLNLLAHVDSDEALTQISEMLADITAAHPCRAIVMLGEPSGADADIEVFLSLQCRPATTGHDRHLCCEQVTLTAYGRFAVELPSAATPLLVPDLPAILWWHGDVEFDDPAFRALCHAVDRVVIDSANFAETRDDILGLVEFWDRQRATDARLSDLNWTRHSAWRSLIAAFFDAPENRRQLDRINRIRVDCVRPKSRAAEVPSPGLILVGWLAGCLDWKVAPQAGLSPADDSWAITLTSKGREILVEWRFVDHENAGECEIVRVELRCDTETDPVHFAIELSADGKYLGTSASGDAITHAPRVLNCPDQDTAQLLAMELNAGGQDLVLERSVRAAAEMIATAK